MGDNAGEVLAGATWALKDGVASITNKTPAAPSQHFKDALKSWEKRYNDAHPNAPFTEPSGGFKY